MKHGTDWKNADAQAVDSMILGSDREAQLWNDLDALKQLEDELTVGGSDSLDAPHSAFLLPPCEVQMGDHVYQWCSFGFVPCVFQHHGIVMDVYWKHSENSERNQNGSWRMTIADFSNADLDVEHSSGNNETSTGRHRSFVSPKGRNKHPRGCFRTYEVECTEWHKVDYQANWWQRHWQRTGTCTAVPSDAPGVVRARVEFLRDRGATCLPPYHAVSANGECVAVWCKTGTWATLQAIHYLAVTAAGQAKSAVTVASVAAATHVTVPSAGVWGWLGYTTQVSLVSTQPMLLPAIAAYGVVTVGAPALWLYHCQRQAKVHASLLNAAFWQYALDHPDEFAEALTMWSALVEPNVEDVVVLEPDSNDLNVVISEPPVAPSSEPPKQTESDPLKESAIDTLETTRIPVPL